MKSLADRLDNSLPSSKNLSQHISPLHRLTKFNMSTSNIPTADSEITDNPDTVNKEATDTA